jgi:3-oxoacyl-[acyl-carrier protein] reductase
MILKGKVALVLGAVKGIGKGLGLALASNGVSVALNYFDWEDHLASLQKDFAAMGVPHLIVQTDLRETNRVESLISQVIDRFGRLDILINNIERGGWPIVHGPYVREQWDLELETTLRAKQWVFEQALPHLKAAGNGIVINFSSIAGIVGRSGPASLVFNEGYAAANRGISILTETWARLGAPEVRVNEIMLGFFESRHGPGTRGWKLLSPLQRQALIDHTLMGRTGTIEDVIKTVLFIIRDASFMTGTVLRLDGGYTVGGEHITPMPPGVL